MTTLVKNVKSPTHLAGTARQLQHRVIVAFVMTFILYGCGLLNSTDNTTAEFQRTDSAPPNDSQAVYSLGSMELIRIRAGHFLMGASTAVVPLQYSKCEFPRHEVVLTDDFLMSRTEFTVGQFRQFVDDTGYLTDAERNGLGGNSLNFATGKVQQLPGTIWTSPGFSQTDDHPVVCVSWKDANAVCQWLSRKHNRRFRLPTEAEWEYACRAGTHTVFTSGDSPESLGARANAGDVALQTAVPLAAGTANRNDGFAFTAPVGSFTPNAFGLYDMHGNVGEWCQDWFDAEFYGRSVVQNPAGPAERCQWRVVRGGSWYNTPFSCRSSGRHDGIETAVSTTNGFRVVAEL